MAPKQQQQSKSSMLIWNQCTNCKYVFVKSLNETHVCGDDKLTLNQAYLFRRYLIANVIEHQKDIDKELDFNREYLFDFVFLNPQTMKLCQFEIGKQVIVTQTSDLNNDSYQTTALCWPLSSVPVDKAAFNKQYLQLNNISSSQLVGISLPERVNTNTSSVQVELIHPVKYVDSFIKNRDDCSFIENYLNEIYLNKCVFNGQLIFVTYLGQKFTFKIRNIVCSSQERVADSCVDDFSKLSLNDSVNSSVEKKTFIEANLKPIEFENRCKLEVCLVNDKTKFSVCLKKNDEKLNEIGLQASGFSSVGGLDTEIEVLRELFVYPFEYSHLYADIGIRLSKGVVLYGSSGCGKTLLARALLNECKCPVVEINCSDIFSRNYGESEAKLKELFSDAWSKSPAVIFVDEIDTLCGKRENLHHDLEKRIVSLFSSLIDQSMAKNILFLATTNKIDLIDNSLRRPGRFDKEIEIPIPTQRSRLEILKIHLKSLKQNLTDSDINEISQKCHGYVGADIYMLVSEAGNVCVKRLIKEKQNNASSITTDNTVTLNDFYSALHLVKASAMREIIFDIEKIYFSDIGGQDELKKKLQQAIVWPLKYGESFKRLGIKAPRGLLMYGPPGCSKTMIAKALATETGLNFLAVKGPELFSKWVGESERTVREIFRKARNAAPAIIFFDEIDAIAVERSSSSNKNNNVGDRVLAQLLNEIDGVENLNDVTIVAATNRPDMIDKALMRPGRLDRIVYVKLPDESTRREIFKLKFKKMPMSDDIDLEFLVKQTEKYSGAEITALCNEAAFLALDENVNSTHICKRHFENAFKMVVPRTSQQTVDYFDNFSLNSGLHCI